jgi:EAL domain-containing protein (putative c-di-GMP-specific phosphodiesterase class I)
MSFDIDDIIRGKKLVACFQPIVSIAKNSVCGLEGLVRGIDDNAAEMISPLDLFAAAECRGVELELDRACRETIICAYRAIHLRIKKPLLFLNLHSSILDKAVGSNHLINMVRRYELNPKDIVIEVNESRVRDTGLMKKFVDVHRNHGFLIALDDVGCGFSNLARISLIKPDIVKIDISLVRNICEDFYVQEVFRSIVNLSAKIGALVVAEGAETEDEAIQTMELGADMIQGFYFSRPKQIVDAGSFVSLGEKIKTVAAHFRNVERKKSVEKRKRYNSLIDVTRIISRHLANVFPDEFDEELLKSVNAIDGIECAYILDEKGIQRSSTVFSDTFPETARSRLFSPAKNGVDHSLKTYYRCLKEAHIQQYITEPYTSLASGSVCMTISKSFRDAQSDQYILCIDFKTVDWAQNNGSFNTLCRKDGSSARLK